MTGWETTGRLDLSRPESTAAPELLAAVRARLSDLLGLDGEGIVLTTDPTVSAANGELRAVTRSTTRPGALSLRFVT